MANNTEGKKTFVYFPWHRSVDVPQGVKRVNVHNSCVKIEDGAFENCSDLEDITLPKDVVTIGKNAFLNCASLKNIKIPKEVEQISLGAFHGCLSLETIDIPDSIKVVEEETFAYCEALMHVNFPLSLKEIGPKAFYNCISLRSANLPKGLVKIGDGAFQFCENLLSCRIPLSIEYIGSKAFACCETLIIVSLPKTLKNIAKDAFEDCSLLAEEAMSTHTNVESFLQGRFKKLPVHSLIYYQINKDSILDDLKKFTKHNQKAIALRDQFGVTTLHLLLCSDHAHIEVVGWLVDQNPDALNAKDRMGRLPLHKAIYAAKAYNASDSIIQLLLDKDDSNMSIYTKSTVLQFIKSGKKAKARPARKALPPTHGSSDKVESILVSHQDGSKELMERAFKKKGVDGMEIHLKERLALHYAIEFDGSTEVVGHLLHKDVHNRTIFERHDDGYLPLQYACRKGVPKPIIKLLIQRDHTNYCLSEDNVFDFYRDRNLFCKEGIEKLVAIGIELENLYVFDAIFTGANPLLFQRTILDNIDDPFILKWLSRISTERSVVVNLMLELYAHILWLAANVFAILVFIDETYKFNKGQVIEPDSIPHQYPFFFVKAVGIAILVFLKLKKLFQLAKYHHLDEFFGNGWNYFELLTIGLVLWSSYYMYIEGVTYGTIVSPNLLMVTILCQFFYFLSYLRKIRLSFSIFVGGVLQIIRGLIPFLIIFYFLLLMFTMMYYILENQHVRKGNPEDVNLRSGVGYFPYDTFFQSFKNVHLLVFLGPTLMESWVDVVFGMFVVILLLNGIILAIVSDNWQATKEKSKQIFYQNRLHFLGSFRSITNDPVIVRKITESVDDSIDKRGGFWTPLALLVKVLIFALGLVTCGLAWTTEIRAFVFGVYVPDEKKVLVLTEETQTNEETSRKEETETKNMEEKVNMLLQYLHKNGKSNETTNTIGKSEDTANADDSQSVASEEEREKLKELSKEKARSSKKKSRKVKRIISGDEISC